MRTNIPACLTALLLGCHFAGLPASSLEAKAGAQTNAPIPWNQIGARAGADYQGNGLAVSATASGARLHCVFQRLDGEATREGLWLSSTVPGQPNDRFRVSAVAVGRSSTLRLSRNQKDSGTRCRSGSDASLQLSTCNLQPATSSEALLPSAGEVSVDGQTVRFSRSGLVEDYSVSMDGIQQDFVVLAKPTRHPSTSGGESHSSQGSHASHSTLTPSLPPTDWPGEGQLRVELAVTGATVEPTANGAQLVLPQSGRRIAYSRLNVTDAKGKQLPAHIEVASHSALRAPHAALVLAILVDDSSAIYPIRIDPVHPQVVGRCQFHKWCSS